MAFEVSGAGIDSDCGSGTEVGAGVEVGGLEELYFIGDSFLRKSRSDGSRELSGSPPEPDLGDLSSPEAPQNHPIFVAAVVMQIGCSKLHPQIFGDYRNRRSQSCPRFPALLYFWKYSTKSRQRRISALLFEFNYRVIWGS